MNMIRRIVLLPGDGIGPEVVNEAVKVLKVIAPKYNQEFVFEDCLIGAAAIEETGSPLPDTTLEKCIAADAILMGAIGDPKYDNDPTAKVRPEQGLLAIRKALGLFANIRPVTAYDSLLDASPLKEDRIKGVDLVVVRELIGGIYFGQPRGRNEAGDAAFDTCTYDKTSILRITELAFRYAKQRRKKITLVDKANVLATSRLWREVVTAYAADHTDIEYDTMYVDNAAMQLVRNPAYFDVVLTENMFGDILSDEASVITGSLGTLPSASIGEKTSLYEPVHGSYPQAAGQNRANPIATILSAAMLLEGEFEMNEAAQDIRNAVSASIEAGVTTEDLRDGKAGTQEVGDFIANAIAVPVS